MKFALTTLLLASTALLATTADAQTAASSSASAPTKPAKTAKKATKKAAPAPVEQDEPEPDVAGTTVFDYQCELGAKLTIYQNKDDADHAAIKWGRRIHQMDRVPTTTGADRFENKHYGLIWIGIPAKGILLDSKTGHQLANECRTPEQVAAQEAAKAAATAQKAAVAADKAAVAADKAADKAAVAADKAAAVAADKAPAPSTGK
jgi:cytochrome c5